MQLSRLLSTSLLAAAAAGCGVSDPQPPSGPFHGSPADIGLTAAAAGFEARLVRGGLNNPSSVAFSNDGRQIAICDSGAGRVLIGDLDGQADDTVIAGFDTEFTFNSPTHVRHIQQLADWQADKIFVYGLSLIHI